MCTRQSLVQDTEEPEIPPITIRDLVPDDFLLSERCLTKGHPHRIGLHEYIDVEPLPPLSEETCDVRSDEGDLDGLLPAKLRNRNNRSSRRSPKPHSPPKLGAKPANGASSSSPGHANRGHKTGKYVPPHKLNGSKPVASPVFNLLDNDFPPLPAVQKAPVVPAAKKKEKRKYFGGKENASDGIVKVETNNAGESQADGATAGAQIEIQRGTESDKTQKRCVSEDDVAMAANAMDKLSLGRDAFLPLKNELKNGKSTDTKSNDAGVDLGKTS